MINRIGAILFLVLANLSFAQKSRFINFGIEDGMINSQVKTINQDQSGNLWIGTIAGLIRYDGSFHNLGEEDGLAENWITTSLEDKDGNLWFGHWGGGLTVYKAHDKSFTDLKIEKATGYNLITSLVDNGNNQIWIGTSSNGLYIYDKVSQKTERYSRTTLPSKINTLESDENGNIWIGTDVGLIIAFKEGVGIYKNIVLNTFTGFRSNVVTSIENVQGKEMWIGTADKGLVRFKQLQGKYRKLQKKELNSLFDDFETKSLNVKLIESDSNIVWVAMEKGGVTQYNLTVDFHKKQKVSRSSIQLTNKQEERYFNSNAIFRDREENVWVGTDIALSRYLGELFNVYTVQDSLSSNLIWETYVNSNGTVYLGSSNGLSKLSFKGDKLISVQNLGDAQGLSENLVVAITEDNQGNLWLGTENTGINVLDPSGQVVRRISTDDGLLDNQIFAFVEDGNTIWVGTKKGVSRVNKIDYSIKNYTVADGLGGNKVYDLFKDKSGNIWFAILGGLLTRYDGQAFETFDESMGVSQKFITGIAQDKSGNLWFGSYGQGLLKYDGGLFTTYTKKNGLSSNNVQFIKIDQSDQIWIGLTLGLDKFDQKAEKFSHYGKQQGFASIEPNEKSASIDQFGNIWFGTTRGAIKFSPNKDKVNEIEPITSIEGLKISLEDADFPEGGVFEYDQNNLTFKVAALSLTNPREVRYKYKLVGFDEEWTNASELGEVTYTNLEPGKYEFMVQASNNNDLWNRAPVSYVFKIEPPFWKTKWFIGILIAIVIIVLFTFIKIRERNFQERQKVLESEVGQRTKELRVEKELSEFQKEIIGTKNKHITDSINYAKKIQDSILPPTQRITAAIPDNFIFFEPRDIVSGDFYWFNQANGKVYAAAVDCTGHGVPGAFMSIIGYNALDKIINEHHIFEPAKILDQLNVEIMNALRQEDQDIKTVTDGMDIALVAIDFEANMVEFAGAYNPLYLVRNGELYEYDGDRVPIGKSSKKDENFEGYTNHVLEVQKEDMLYIFSDGFVDQKGGKKGKKYKYPRFRGLLSELSTMDVQTQHESLNATLEHWMGDHQQFDDMLIWGIKI